VYVFLLDKNKKYEKITSLGDVVPQHKNLKNRPNPTTALLRFSRREAALERREREEGAGGV
jgi:hypothetical protein